MAETLAGGAVAVTRIEPEVLTPGVAVTGAPATIDEIESCLDEAASIETLLFERARTFGSW